MISAEDLVSFVHRDPVLFASMVLALVSMVLVPPSSDYIDYIDVRTLAILLCLMAVVSGISRTGTFGVLAQRLLEGNKGICTVCLVLVLLPLVLSMFITNDVSLITFVPFAIIVLDMARRRDLIVPVVVLQTVAANLGSMLLPFGNPQNIFIESKYDVGLIDFIITTGPLVLVGSIVLLLIMLRFRGGRCDVSFDERENPDASRLCFLLALFAMCILSVLRAIPYQYTLVVVLVGVTAVYRDLLLRVDWGLLLTFVFLFIFAGNIASVDAVSDVLGDLMSWNPVFSSAMVSQAISNVPATVMLSNFTDDWSGLLSGANIGGFGTPIASMASIITLRLYSRESDADRRRFLKVFTAANVIMLVLLLSIGTVL